jgi:hypothetical protein
VEKVLELLETGFKIEDELENKANNHNVGDFIHTGTTFYLSGCIFNKIEEKGFEPTNNQKRIIGYPLALLGAHIKERYRDEIYNVQDIPSWVLGVEMRIQYDELREQIRYGKIDALAESELYQEELRRKLEPLGKTG